MEETNHTSALEATHKLCDALHDHIIALPPDKLVSLTISVCRTFNRGMGSFIGDMVIFLTIGDAITRHHGKMHITTVATLADSMGDEGDDTKTKGTKSGEVLRAATVCGLVYDFDLEGLTFKVDASKFREHVAAIGATQNFKTAIKENPTLDPVKAQEFVAQHQDVCDNMRIVLTKLSEYHNPDHV